MSIHALPTGTIDSIGSTQALSDSCAVVKELIDNALDARATSIVVEVSADLISLIVVKDNGHGVPHGDRHLLAHRHCTSKIDAAQDLTKLGGRFLGFRGEALSHLVDMSGELSITTRTEGEATADMMILTRQGGCTGTQRRSHNVGTTVKVVDFLKHYPVRKQVVLKKTRRTIKAVHLLLQSYAFARPTVRFAFSVLKQLDGTDRWTYAPSPGGSLAGATAKLIGPATASLCSVKQIEHDHVSLEALLPEPGKDISKLSGLGEYVSVDGRPMSNIRGFGKKLFNTIKEHPGWKAALGDTANRPLLCLRFSTKDLPYDISIEPAKDDVLFEDFTPILSALDGLLNEIYPIGQMMPSLDTPSGDPRWSNRLQTHAAKLRPPSTSAEMTVEVADKPPVSNFKSRPAEMSPSRPCMGAETFSPPQVNSVSLSAKEFTTAEPVSRTMLPLEARFADVARPQLSRSISGLLTPDISPNKTHFPDVTRRHISVRQVSEPSIPPHCTTEQLFGQQPDAMDGSIPPAFSMPHHHTNFPSSSAYPTPATPARINAAANDTTSKPAWTITKAQKPQKTNTSVNKPYKRPSAVAKDPARDAWFDLPEIARDERARKKLRKTIELSTDVSPHPTMYSSTPGGDTKDIRSFMRAEPSVPEQGALQVEPALMAGALPAQTRYCINPPPPMPGPPTTLHPSHHLQGPTDQENSIVSETSSRPHRDPCGTPRPALTELHAPPNGDTDPRQLLLLLLQPRPRTKSGKLARTKSSLLPFETVSPARRMQMLVQRLWSSSSEEEEGKWEWEVETAPSTSGFDGNGLFAMTEDWLGGYGGLQGWWDREGLQGLIGELRRVLRGYHYCREGGGEVTGELEGLVLQALEASAS